MRRVLVTLTRVPVLGYRWIALHDGSMTAVAGTNWRAGYADREEAIAAARAAGYEVIAALRPADGDRS